MNDFNVIDILHSKLTAYLKNTFVKDEFVLKYKSLPIHRIEIDNCLYSPLVIFPREGHWHIYVYENEISDLEIEVFNKIGGLHIGTLKFNTGIK